MKRGGGGRGRGVGRTKSLRLCCAAEPSEGTSFHTGSAVLVQTDTACSISHSQSGGTKTRQVILNCGSESFTFQGCASFFGTDTLKQADVEAGSVTDGKIIVIII